MKNSVRTLLIAAFVGCTLVTGTGVATAAQGGTDWNGTKSQNHSWMKVTKAELRSKTVDQACKELRLGSQCNNLVPLIVNEKYKRPNANGYWAENYFTPWRTRSGSW